MENTNLEFEGFPKIARLSREIIITEKIDGTNAQISITERGDLFVGSRKRWITPSDDNFGFAKWVYANKEDILKLGIGKHFGEWWGSGIQRGYDLPKGEKRFSLFNTIRWCLHGKEIQLISTNHKGEEKWQEELPECIGLVPTLYKGIFSESKILNSLIELEHKGSIASPGYMNPEGIVIFHTAANMGFKKTIKNDETPKSKHNKQ